MLARDPLPDFDPADQAEDDEAFAEYQAKGGVSHEAVARWLRSWGTADELPPPQIGD